jgi:L-seryl-tRNA(Ser) seleniumtransferase
MLLKIHRSNFAMVGFTAEASVVELAALARERGVAFAYDAGSGCLREGPTGEPTVASVVEAGADAVMFSGDKLLGGPQAGVIVGRGQLLESMRRHPLMRALRPDKLCLAALVATLRLWRDDPGRIPVVRFAAIEPAVLEVRARALAESLGAGAIVVATVARMGGGTAPLHEIPSAGVRLSGGGASLLLGRLRDGEPAVVARIEDDAVVFDLRCIPPEDDVALAAAIARARNG